MDMVGRRKEAFLLRTWGGNRCEFFLKLINDEFVGEKRTHAVQLEEKMIHILTQTDDDVA
jgi:hypothetical protein